MRDEHSPHTKKVHPKVKRETGKKLKQGRKEGGGDIVFGQRAECPNKTSENMHCCSQYWLLRTQKVRF